MNTRSTKNTLKHSIISLLLLGFFMILATSSQDLLIPFGIYVKKHDKGGGIIEELETHSRGQEAIYTTGVQDEGGRWHGWIDIEYYLGDEDNRTYLYKERVYMVHGRRNGICTRTYPDDRVEEEHYINGMKVSLKKTTGMGPLPGLRIHSADR